MGSTTITELRQLTASLLGDNVTGDVTSGAVNALTDTRHRNEADGYWAGVYVHKYPVPFVQYFDWERRIITFTQAISTMVAESSFTNPPQAGDAYELHFLMPARIYNEFLTYALRSLAHRGVLLGAVVDETLTWVTDQYDYTVPAGLTAIRRIDKQTTTGAPGSDDFEPLPSEQWEIRRSTTRKIVFGKNFSQLSNGQQLRIHGYSEFADPTDDANTYTVDPFVVAYLAASMIAGSLIANEPTAHWREMEQRLSAMAERYEARERQIFDGGLRYVNEH